MKKEELTAKGLTEEQAKAVMEIYTEEMKGYIPKSRFDEVNTAKADLEKQVVDRDKQLKTLKDEAKDSEALQNKITELEETNKPFYRLTRRQNRKKPITKKRRYSPYMGLYRLIEKYTSLQPKTLE